MVFRDVPLSNTTTTQTDERRTCIERYSIEEDTMLHILHQTFLLIEYYFE